MEPQDTQDDTLDSVLGDGPDDFDSYFDSAESDDTTEADAADTTEPGADAEETSQAAPADAAPTDDKAGTDSTATAQAATETPKESTTAATPAFSYKADGRTYEVPGATQEADGSIRLTKEAWARHIQPQLADRSAWQKKELEYRRQVDALNPERHPEVVKSREFNTRFEALLDQGPEAVAEFLDKLVEQRPLLERDAQLAAQKAQLDAFNAEREAQTAQAREEAMRPQLQGFLKSTLTQAAERNPAAKGLDTTALYERLWDHFAESGQLFYVAQQDQRFEDGSVLRAGEVGVKWDVMEREFNYAVQQHARTQSALAEARKAAQVNAAVTAPASRKAPPPAVPAKGSASGARKVVPAKSRREFEDSLLDDLLSD